MKMKKMKKSILTLALATGLSVIGGGFALSYLIDSAVPVYAAVEDVPLIFNDSAELLESIYEKMGNIMWPIYFPEGFALSDIGILNPIDFSDNCYRHLNILNVAFTDSENNMIRLWIRYFQPYVPLRNSFSLDLHYEPPTLMEHESLIDINGFKATLGPPTFPYWPYYRITLWDTDNGLTDLFTNPHVTEIPYGGTSYEFSADHDAGISEADLIRMAESLTNIINLMQ